MAFLTKLKIVALLLAFLSFYGARISSASSLHQREKQSSRWFSDCQRGHSRKLGRLNCEIAGGLTNMNGAHWSESLKSTLSPPPAPVKKVATRAGIVSPPTK